MNIEKVINNSIAPQLLHTTIAALAFFIAALIIFLLFKRKFELTKQMAKFRSRLSYVAICVFVIAIIQI